MRVNALCFCNYPDLFLLVLWEFLAFWFVRKSFFLLRFSLLSQRFGGSPEKKNPYLFIGFPCILPKRQAKEGYVPLLHLGCSVPTLASAACRLFFRVAIFASFFASNLLHFPKGQKTRCFSFETGSKCRQQIGLNAKISLFIIS